MECTWRSLSQACSRSTEMRISQSQLELGQSWSLRSWTFSLDKIAALWYAFWGRVCTQLKSSWLPQSYWQTCCESHYLEACYQPSALSTSRSSAGGLYWTPFSASESPQLSQSLWLALSLTPLTPQSWRWGPYQGLHRARRHYLSRCFIADSRAFCSFEPPRPENHQRHHLP